MASKAADVHFVDDRPTRGESQRRVALPVVRATVDDHVLHRGRGVFARGLSRLTAVAVRHNDSAAIRVEQRFRLVKTQAIFRPRGSRDAIGIELASPKFGY